jgi:hypothetical protein
MQERLLSVNEVARRLGVSGRQLADAELRAVVNAWPVLPEAIRAGILALVRTARGTVK